jgi:molybdopterin adenylyltransferase
VRAAVLTVSDGVARGEREDESGDLLARLLTEEGYEVDRGVVEDDRERVAAALGSLIGQATLVLTTGGTGFGPRDVTPEATSRLIERPAPGIAEAIRADAIARTPHGLLSRGVAGRGGGSLIVILTGSRGACSDGFAVLRPALAHALGLLSGEATTMHRQT